MTSEILLVQSFVRSFHSSVLCWNCHTSLVQLKQSKVAPPCLPACPPILGNTSDQHPPRCHKNAKLQQHAPIRQWCGNALKKPFLPKRHLFFSYGLLASGHFYLQSKIHLFIEKCLKHPETISRICFFHGFKKHMDLLVGTEAPTASMRFPRRQSIQFLPSHTFRIKPQSVAGVFERGCGESSQGGNG